MEPTSPPPATPPTTTPTTTTPPPTPEKPRRAYASPLERVAPRRILRDSTVRSAARAEMVRAGIAHPHASTSALETVVQLSEALVRRVGATAARHTRARLMCTMTKDDVVHALSDLNIVVTAVPAPPPLDAAAAAAVARHPISENMLARAMHHELAYSHESVKRRRRARVTSSVGATMHQVLRIFLRLLLRAAVLRVKKRAAGGATLRTRDVVRAHAAVVRACTRHSALPRDVPEHA